MIATTRAALIRGESEDELGDEIDGGTIVDGYADFPISIIETSRNEFDEASNAWRTVRYYSGRCSMRIPVRAGDRIRDNRDASFYIVDEAERTARGISGRSSVTLTMRRTAP